MGGTIPSFRIASIMKEKEWKSFRNFIDKSERKIFDDMFAISHLYNSACSYSAKYIRIYTLFSCLSYSIIINNLCNSHRAVD
jgi:hypothetical protein